MDLGGQPAGLDARGSGCPEPPLLNGLPALPVATARPIVLTATERHRLKKSGLRPQDPAPGPPTGADRAAGRPGLGNAAIARKTGANLNTVRTWRVRIAGLISASAVRRWLREDTLEPWQYRSWPWPTSPSATSTTPASSRARTRAWWTSQTAR